MDGEEEEETEEEVGVVRPMRGRVVEKVVVVVVVEEKEKEIYKRFCLGLTFWPFYHRVDKADSNVSRIKPLLEMTSAFSNLGTYHQKSNERGGKFSACRDFFTLIACAGFFLQVKPSALIFLTFFLC